jgi:hypothetical protein
MRHLGVEKRLTETVRAHLLHFTHMIGTLLLHLCPFQNDDASYRSERGTKVLVIQLHVAADDVRCRELTKPAVLL